MILPIALLAVAATVYAYGPLGFTQKLVKIFNTRFDAVGFGVFTFVMKCVFGAKEVSVLSMLNRFAPKPKGTFRSTIIAAVVVIWFFWLVSGHVRTALNALRLCH